MRSINFFSLGLTQLIKTEETIEPEYIKATLYDRYKVKEDEKLQVSDQAVQIHLKTDVDPNKFPSIKEVFLLGVSPLQKGEKYSKETPTRVGKNLYNPFNLNQTKLRKSLAEKLSDNMTSQEKGTYISYTVQRKSDEEIKKNEEAGIKDDESPGLYIVINKNNFVSSDKTAFQVCCITKVDKKTTLHHSFDIFRTERDEDIPKDKDGKAERKTTKVLVARQIEYKGFREIRKYTEMKEFWFLVITFSVCFLTFIFFFLKT